MLRVEQRPPELLNASCVNRANAMISFRGCGGGVFRPAVVIGVLLSVLTSASGGFATRPVPGLCPWTMLGLSSPRPLDPDPLILQTR